MDNDKRTDRANVAECIALLAQLHDHVQLPQAMQAILRQPRVVQMIAAAKCYLEERPPTGQSERAPPIVVVNLDSEGGIDDVRASAPTTVIVIHEEPYLPICTSHKWIEGRRSLVDARFFDDSRTNPEACEHIARQVDESASGDEPIAF